MENENFFTNFVRMTFEGKGMFWAICGVILIIALIYMFSSRLREKMQKARRFWLLIPIVVLIGAAVWAVIGANQ